MAASLAIPTIVSGTIVIAMFVSVVALRETLSWNQILGAGLIVAGVVFLFIEGRPSH